MVSINSEALRSLTIEINYLTPFVGKPAYYLYEPEPYRRTKPPPTEPRMLEIYDARPEIEQFTLDENGFCFASHPLSVLDYFSHAIVRQSYYSQCAELVSRVTGANYTVAFDHNIRDEGLVARAGVDTPVRLAHNDFTQTSSEDCFQRVLPKTTESPPVNRYVLINVWRPLLGPVDDMPLAVCDAQSLESEDFVETDFIYPDRTSEIYSVKANPNHQWYFLDKMNTDEVLLFKCFDSDPSAAARFTAHTSFRDPRSRPNTRPRRSIEVRTIACFS